jgi:hypothetical protein
MGRKNRFTDKVGKHTAQDEENLALEILEDSRLRSLGIDPDGDSIEITLALEKLVEKHEQERLAYLKNKAAESDKEAE